MMQAERAFLSELAIDCNIPIAGLSQINGSTIEFTGELFSTKSTKHIQVKTSCSIKNPENAGIDAAIQLKKSGKEIFDEYRS
jgi:hydroxymethylbilane synthase